MNEINNCFNDIFIITLKNYIYSLSYKGFYCTCEDEGTLTFDRDFNFLVCPFCKKKWSFGDIRKRITKQDEIDEIGDIMKLGYVLGKEEEEHPIDPEKSPVKVKKKKEKEEKPEDYSDGEGEQYWD